MNRLLLLMAVFSLQAESVLQIDLGGAWRAHRGDQPAFGAPDFDDRFWTEISLPGGLYPSGTYWLRRRVDLPAWLDRKELALTLGNVGHVYEVFCNGRRIGASSPFDALEDAQIPRPRTFGIPPEAVADGGTITIALRVKRGLRFHPDWILPDRGPYLLTTLSNAPTDAGRQQLTDRWVQKSPRLIMGAFFFCIGLLSWFGWRLDPGRKELLWLALIVLNLALAAAEVFYQLLADGHPFTAGGSAWDSFFLNLHAPLLTELALATLAIRPSGWRVATWLAWGVSLWGSYANGSPIIFPLAMTFCASTTVLAVLLNWRNLPNSMNTFEPHLIRLLLLLPALSMASDWIGRVEVRRRAAELGPAVGVGDVAYFALGPYHVRSRDVFWLFVAIALLVQLLHRVIVDQREKQRLASELEAARTVQQLLLPISAARSEVFEANAVYEPAQEVGGDFHWSRTTVDGALIVVVGDVSGKGLKAAMLVSVAIGILRTVKSSSPAAILAALNEGLTGHTGGGFVTCCCARFDADGTVTIANAGHPSPYCDDREVEVEAGLPLGIMADVVYDEAVVKGSRFTFVSDGVVEAENAQRELFGFDRTREISGKSAQEIAAAAKAWGQNDDITVVTVRRNG